MKKLNSINEVLNEALKRFLKNRNFICNILYRIENDLKDSELDYTIVTETLKFLKKNKPSEIQHTEFYNNEYFYDKISWWDINPNKSNLYHYDNVSFEEEFKNAYKERERFLKLLIEISKEK